MTNDVALLFLKPNESISIFFKNVGFFGIFGTLSDTA